MKNYIGPILMIVGMGLLCASQIINDVDVNLTNGLLYCVGTISTYFGGFFTGEFLK